MVVLAIPCVFICVVIILTLYIRKIIKPYKQSETAKDKTIEDDYGIKTEFETVKYNAEVTDMFCRVDSVGIKTPKAVRIFTVVFETDDKKTIKLDIPQGMYDGIEIGQVGELTLVEGELYSFVI